MESLRNTDDAMSKIYCDFARELAEIGDEINAQFTDRLNGMELQPAWSSNVAQARNARIRLADLAALLQADNRAQPSALSWIGWSSIAGIASATVLAILMFRRR